MAYKDEWSERVIYGDRESIHMNCRQTGRTYQKTMSGVGANRRKLFDLYISDGFDVDVFGNLSRQPFIDVKATEAKVDGDFYNHNDGEANES